MSGPKLSIFRKEIVIIISNYHRIVIIWTFAIFLHEF